MDILMQSVSLHSLLQQNCLTSCLSLLLPHSLTLFFGQTIILMKNNLTPAFLTPKTTHTVVIPIVFGWIIWIICCTQQQNRHHSNPSYSYLQLGLLFHHPSPLLLVWCAFCSQFSSHILSSTDSGPSDQHILDQSGAHIMLSNTRANHSPGLSPSQLDTIIYLPLSNASLMYLH